MKLPLPKPPAHLIKGKRPIKRPQTHIKAKNDNNTQLTAAQQDFHNALNAEDYKTALTATQTAHRLAPHLIAPLSDMATVYIKLEDWNNAITSAHKALQINPNHINSLDVLSHAYGAKRDWKNVAIYGKRALMLRDEKITDAPNLSTPFMQQRDDTQNIIAFSLFGDSSAYIEPAVLNAQLVAKIYPNWQCRFYVDDSVPDWAVDRLSNTHSHIVKINDEHKNLPKTMWRFLAMDDESVGYVLFRDADSVISRREAAAVSEWMASGQAFHIIRDAGSHTELILAGLWGAKAGVVPDMTAKMHAYAAAHSEHRHSDQFFLRDCIWAYVRQDVYASDRLFDFGDTHPITTVGFDHDKTHIGCDEGSSLFTLTSKQLNVGDWVVWRLHSRIDPYLNEDLSYNLTDEQLICSYKTQIKKAATITGRIPRIYARGIPSGDSRIDFAWIDKPSADN